MDIQILYDRPILSSEKAIGGAFRIGSIVRYRGHELPVIDMQWFVNPPFPEHTPGWRVVPWLMLPSFGKVPISNVDLVEL